MRHKKTVKKLDRNQASRQALYRSLANNLFVHKKIVTTKAKAKAIKPIVEQYITKAKTNTITTRRLLLQRLGNEQAVTQLMDTIALASKQRVGGYTRIVWLGKRQGDGAELAQLEII